MQDAMPRDLGQRFSCKFMNGFTWGGLSCNSYEYIRLVALCRDAYSHTLTSHEPPIRA